MMTDRRIMIVCLVLVTVIVSSLVRTSEGSRYHSDEDNKNPRHRHRHRHDATSVTSSRRNHESSLSSPRRSPWPQQEDDYEDALDVDEDDDEEDEDYDVEPRTRTLYERNYQPARNTQRNYHARFESRYPLRYHQTGHHANPWYRGVAEEDTERRRNTRYGGIAGSRGHRQRSGRDRTQHHEDRRRGEATSGYPSRNHDFEDPGEDPEDEVEMDHDTGYDRNSRRWRFEEDSDENPQQDYRGSNSGSSRWRSSRRHRPYDHYDVTPESKGYRGRQEARRNDWKSRTSNSPGSAGISSGQRNEDEDWMDRRRKTGTSHRKRPSRPLPIDEPEYDDAEEDRNENRGSWSNKKSRNNLNDRVFNSGVDRRKENDLDYRDYDYDINDNGDNRKMDKRREEQEKEEEEDDIWNDDEDNDDPDDDDQDFDNTNYYKSEDEPPYKTFDDIIKSLTSEDPTTPKPTIRREYRNTGVEKYLRRDAYGNMYDSRNVTVTVKSVNELSNSGRLANWNNNATNRWRGNPSKPDIASYSSGRDNKKLSNAIGDNASWKAGREHERKRIRAKLEEPQPKTKSLEQEYDEDWDNNEKDEDIVKVAGGHVTEMQSDVTNTEYADEENETETEGETSAPLVTSTPKTTTTSTTTTTTTTTTTPRPIVTTSPPRVTQERRDSRSYETSTAPQSNGLHQQQSVHGSHKWQTLTTRDGSKNVNGQVQPKNKDGKAEDIKEALQHAIKVSREGSCRWPRARVIPVRDVYPSPSTTYVPHCAILHRCSDDTGCCRSEALTCVPKVSHRVELYFYTNNLAGSTTVEKLSFYNHTECECKERTDETESSDKTGVTNEHRHHTTAVSPPQNIRRPPQRKPCKCPSEFTPRITLEGVCQCNCYENDQNCIRARRGKGYFSFRDRLCIQNEECTLPMCEFGQYMRRQGKCPRKKDKFNEMANFHRFRS